MPVLQISAAQHPVKAGLSDAFMVLNPSPDVPGESLRPRDGGGGCWGGEAADPRTWGQLHPCPHAYSTRAVSCRHGVSSPQRFFQPPWSPPVTRSPTSLLPPRAAPGAVASPCYLWHPPSGPRLLPVHNSLWKKPGPGWTVPPVPTPAAVPHQAGVLCPPMGLVTPGV